MTLRGPVLVTGANGFVGRALVERFLRDGIEARAAVRRDPGNLPTSVRVFSGLELGRCGDWSDALRGVSAVVHCAARVHMLNDHAADPLAEFRRVNVAGSVDLAMQASAANVRRFVFISSAHVNGTRTSNRAFTADDAVAPTTPYGLSKQEAEIALRQCLDDSATQLVVIRPPLVIGPGVGGNMRTLLRALRRRWPLPLGAIDNRRSLVGLDNLVDLVACCIGHPAAAGQTFMVSDGEDVSTPTLLRQAGHALGRPAILLPAPVPLLQGLARIAGRSDAMHSLCGSLQIDIAKTRALLGWSPTVSLVQELERTAQHFIAQGGPR